MCGYLGLASKKPLHDEFDKIFRDSLNKIDHRGPDGEGVYNDNGVYLGHKRLSVIDLSSAANQPLLSASKGAHIVFNGEIYNYKEISSGLILKTQSDTEVLLEGFLRDGPTFLEKIRGIYSFAIYDHAKRKIFLCRDPGGVKPLYYTVDHGHGELIFGSELKAILPLLPTLEYDESVLKHFIHLGYCMEPKTIYKNVIALEPGHLLTFDMRSGNVSKQEVHKYVFNKLNEETFNSNIIRSTRYLEQACQRNLVADVDIAIALSGGIDSALVLGFSHSHRNLKCITIKFDEKEYDESEIARVYAAQFKVGHRIISVAPSDQLSLVNRLLLHFDQPYADSSLIPFYFLNKEAAKFSKVLIGGDGGDEIQNGYTGYSVLPLLLKFRKSRWKYIVNFVLNVLFLIVDKDRHRQLHKIKSILNSDNRDAALFEWHSWFPVSRNRYSVYPFRYDPDKVHQEFSLGNEESDSATIAANYFRKRMQSDFLRKSDMMSMINGVEFRLPMLDEDLVDFSLSVPFSQKSNLINHKLILRKIHNTLYPGFTSRLKKKGFSIPLDRWLGTENLDSMRQFILRDDGIVLKYVKSEYIDVLFDGLDRENNQERRYCSRASTYQRIFILYALQLWYIETFIKFKSYR